jgi:two-component system chemotaxis response regulator CheB
MVTRILICDASRDYAMALRTLLERDDSLEVVGISPSGEHAVQSVKRLAPSLVTMALELPGMDGVEATKAIMQTNPVPIVVLSALAHNGSATAAAALAAGAVEALSKPKVTIADVGAPAAAALRGRLKLLARAHVAAVRVPPPAASAPAGRSAARTALAVGIGASTGGPKALRTVLGELPANFQLPLLVVQHIGAEFLSALVHWLDEEIALPVGIAQDTAVAGPGVWLAPDGAHLTVDRSMRVVLDRRTPPGHHRPSVDMLLESMASSLGPQAVGVVLTGMGTDGANGIAAITARGGLGIAQDEASSVLFGMPRAAAEQGAQMVLPLTEIPVVLRGLRIKDHSR